MTNSPVSDLGRPIPARTRIKVCGIRDLDAALAAAEAGADAIGFIFHPDSPRFIEPAAAAPIMWSLPPMISTVAVTVDLSVDEFADIEQTCPATLTQLHGREPEAVVRACGPNLIKAFRYDHATIVSQLTRWGAVDEVDAVLIDGSDGGQGDAFDWSQLVEHAKGFEKPIFLAGGLTPDNVGEAIAAVRPYAVDVSSGVESAPGVKDLGLIAEFCQAVREADAASAI